MSTFSRGLLAATLTGSLALSGTAVASANDCGTPSAEFTATVDGKEHTFKKVTEFLWQATDDEDVTLSRADIFQLANEEEDVCSSEPIDLDDWGTGNNDSGSESDEREDDDSDSEDDSNNDAADKDGDDADKDGKDDADKDGDDADKDGKDDADKDGDDADSGKDGDDADSGKDKDDQNKDKKSSFKDALSSEDGKPSGLGIATIVISVLGALAAAAPHAARALGIKLPF
ncbi:hypothetical protein [Corynebacterium minutissimum]|uniref:Uncharacterized protein n=1 Tax=Corynebacterium minutissimum TaxID=38301 RepID=A0A376CU36_9CORY|nr:hypothetical protein [Corynebacterium minutissimum]QRP60298.1 hypothetical protein I6J26_08880 [Corynebacterium minutissimum]STC75243.1 Uncharacterised protein [Corynebacterium minutissimum]